MIVLDSSFLVAFHNRRDVHHDAAARLMDELLQGRWGAGLLLEYVFLEVTTVLAVRRNPETAVTVGETLLEAHELEFVPCSEIFLDAWELFQDQRPPRAGGALSFVDAAIATVARRRAMGRIATFDRDFAHLEGIEVVPEP